MSEITYGFISMWHGKGGQHTNGPDYGVVTAEHGPAGMKIEVQTGPRFGPHKARMLCQDLIELAVQEMSK